MAHRAVDAFHVAIALDGAGFHGAGWRDGSAEPLRLFEAAYWAEIAAAADDGLVTFLTVEDSFGIQSSCSAAPDDRTDQVRGRLDAVLTAAYLARKTTVVGIVPTMTTTHTEPFHVACSLGTLDYVSQGRSGWLSAPSLQQSEANHVGRRTICDADSDSVEPDHPQNCFRHTDLLEEAARVIEVVRCLWDSWEDDAVIRDVTSGRYIDRTKVHHVNFVSRFFTVKGPSTLPRPLQGNPPIALQAHSAPELRLANTLADVAFVSANQVRLGDLAGIRSSALAERELTEPLKIFADLVVHLDSRLDRAIANKRRLDTWNAGMADTHASVFVGTPDGLAKMLTSFARAGFDGVRLMPAVIRHDFDHIIGDVLPHLDQIGVIRRTRASETLRERLGLSHVISRYARTFPSGGRAKPMS